MRQRSVIICKTAFQLFHNYPYCLLAFLKEDFMIRLSEAARQSNHHPSGEEAMRILVLGTGGTGGYFGGRLAQANIDVTFLVRSQRALFLRDNGLIITSGKGNAQIPVKTVTADHLPSEGKYDLILLTCKAYDLDSAIPAITPAAGPTTIIMPLLNGLLHLDRLDATFGQMNVLGGLCHISASLDPAGRVVHLPPFLHRLVFGPRVSQQRDVCDSIATVFAPAAFDVSIDDNIMQGMWEKFSFLSALAASTCLTRGCVGDILHTDDGEALMTELIRECQSVATASGFPLRPEALSFMENLLKLRDSTLAASMLRDLESGRQVEADHIVGDILKRGKSLNQPLALLQAAYCHLQVYQNARATGK